MSKHADVTLTRGHKVSSLLSLLNVVFSAHYCTCYLLLFTLANKVMMMMMTNAGRLF